MDNLFKKKLIASLLAVSCVLCVLSLATENERPYFVNPADADSIIFRELSAFNVPANNISWQRIDVDSTFYRKNYRVRLPMGISRTWFHSELSRKLHDHNMKTWGKVAFPENSMNIHILGNNTVLRSIRLEIDTSYYQRVNPATVMIYFDRAPTDNIMNKIDNLGETIPIVLRVRSAAQAEAWAEKVRPMRNRHYFWMEDGDDTFNEERFIQHSQSLTRVNNRPGLLFFRPVASNPGPDFYKRLADKNISLINTRNATIINSSEGRVYFDLEFDKFSQQARRGQFPVALIRASEQSLDWLANQLVELKKGGTVLTLPPSVSE